MGTLNGKVAMVTGCGGERGIGRAIARRFAAAGADLVLTDVAPGGTRVVPSKPAGGWGGLEAVAAEVRAAGQRALTALLDIRSAPQIEWIVAQALATFGRLDILVNNAAAPPGADRVPVVQLTEEAWDTVMGVNLKGSFLCAKAVATVMLRQSIRGRIINIGSDNSKVGQPNLAAYCASKFGVIGFTQSHAQEMASFNVTVNCICPGEVDTHMWRDVLSPAIAAASGVSAPEAFDAFIKQRVPMGRPQTAADMGQAVVFLCKAENITGIALNVNGGTEMH